MVTLQNENTFKKACADGINLFLGSGFALLAEDSEGRSLPTGGKLFEELVQQFEIGAAEGLSLAQLCTIIESERKQELRSFLTRRFSVEKFDPRYRVLDALAVHAIFTTNIDNLSFKIFADSKWHYLNDLSVRGPAFVDRSAVDFVALHGSIVHDGEPLVFGSTDLAASFSLDPDKWHFLTGQLQRRPTLFWGYSLGDAGVLQALNPASTRGRAHQDKWIVLRNPTDPDKKFFAALGFQIIESDTASLLDYLKDSIPAPQPIPGKKRPTAELFPENALPAIGSMPVRPLIDFFLGAPPSWPDVYSGRIPRTHHFAKVLDLINAGKDVAVIGMPACGKTTLMMQLASQVQFDGHKLACSFLTDDKASLILRKLQGERALIFVDDFADSIEALSTLMEAANVLVVGFDRDYNYEMASHKVSRGDFEVIDVSGLSAQDIQAVFSVIPLGVRRPNYRAPTMEEGVSPSLYEIIENNITEPVLRERFRGVLQQIESEDQQLHDLLVMCCYVHSCRTPVSFDMALAFMRDLVDGFDELYECFNRLRNVIVGYLGEFVDSEQDHFVSRSTLFSEAILDQVSSQSFRRVLLRFHNEVSPFRICRFDIFRRRAFDERFIGKAFPNWRDGMDFYDKQYQHDHSPYLRQQGALYLSHKKRFIEAFQWIDEAVLGSQYKIPSIRNSHAIILFKANVEAPEGGGTKRETLDRSMTILAECYRYDRRKTYHAVVFADQACQYYNLYGDGLAVEYLNTAAKWLKEEKRQNPWNRNVTRLLRLVEQRLQA